MHELLNDFAAAFGNNNPFSTDVPKKYSKKFLRFLNNMDPIYQVIRFFRNLKIYWKILRNDEWWDYAYVYDLLEVKLESMLEHWGKDTHYVGDRFARGRLCIILKYLKEYRKKEECIDCSYEEVKAARDRFWNALRRNINRFWD